MFVEDGLMRHRRQALNGSQASARSLSEQERKEREYLLTLWLKEHDCVITGAITGRGVRGHDVEDVKQDVCRKAWGSLIRGDALPISPENWLWRIANLSALDLRLEESRMKRLLPIEPCEELDQVTRRDAVEPPDEAAQAEISEALVAAIASLDFLLGVVLERRLDGHSFTAIAAKLGRPYGRIRRSYQRALLLLKAKLDGRHEELL